MTEFYVDYRDGGYWIAGTRISLESILFLFLDGFSPKTIMAECFPLLSLPQVYGTIAFYLSHRREMDSYLRQVEGEFVDFQQAYR